MYPYCCHENPVGSFKGYDNSKYIKGELICIIFTVIQIN